jgi:hypothetical protein
VVRQKEEIPLFGCLFLRRRLGLLAMVSWRQRLGLMAQGSLDYRAWHGLLRGERAVGRSGGGSQVLLTVSLTLVVLRVLESLLGCGCELAVGLGLGMVLVGTSPDVVVVGWRFR